MPTYEAECPTCKARAEYFCKMSEKDNEDQLPDCEVCKIKMQPAFAGNPDGGFVLKGRGWFNKGGY